MRGGHVWATPPPGARAGGVVVVYFEAPRFLEAFAGLPDVSRGEGAPTELLWAARKVNLCWRPAAASVGSPAAGLPPPPAWAARLTGACDAAPAPRAGPVPCAVVREVLGRWRLHSGWGAGGGAQGAQTEDAAEIARWDLRRGDALAAAVANALGGLRWPCWPCATPRPSQQASLSRLPGSAPRSCFPAWRSSKDPPWE